MSITNMCMFAIFQFHNIVQYFHSVSACMWYNNNYYRIFIYAVVMCSLQELSMKTSILSDTAQDFQLPDCREGHPPTS